MQRCGVNPVVPVGSPWLLALPEGVPSAPEAQPIRQVGNPSLTVGRRTAAAQVRPRKYECYMREACV